MIYTFGSFSLDTARFELRAGDENVALEPQVFGLLALLVENRDRVVPKDEIFERVWDGRIVSDGTLNTRLNAARRAVGDDGKSQRVIRTFPRQGVRFMADVTEQSDSAADIPISTALPEQPSIAVLPLENLSGDDDQEYFSDGITEDIITALSHIRQFFVISRASSFYFKGQQASVRQVAEELGVRYVLEGSVRKSGNRVRISVKLADGISGSTLWAESYDRELTDIFAVQDEITETIVGRLSPAMILADAERAVRMPDGNLAAWDLLQRGNYHYYLHTKEGFLEARKWYELAIDKAPQLVFAYSALAELYFLDSIWRIFSTHETAIDQSLLLARHAVSLDREDSTAHTALGRALMGEGMGTGQYESAISAFEFALSKNPNMAQAHYMLGRSLSWADNPAGGRAHLELAMRLSPRDPYLGLILAGMGEVAFLEKDFQSCVQWMEKATLSMPTITWVARVTHVAALAHLDNIEGARLTLKNLMEFVPDFTPDLVRNQFKCAYQEDILDGLAKAGGGEIP